MKERVLGQKNPPHAKWLMWVMLQRWAVYNACELLRKYKGEYDRLQEAMGQKKDVPACIQAIEGS